MKMPMPNEQMVLFIEASRLGYAQGLTHPIEWLMNYLDNSQMPMEPNEYKDKAKQVIDAFIAFFRGAALAGPNPQSEGKSYEEVTGVAWEEVAVDSGYEDVAVSIHDVNNPEEFIVDPIAYLDYDGLYIMIHQHYNQDSERLKQGFEIFKQHFGLEEVSEANGLTSLFGLEKQKENKAG